MPGKQQLLPKSALDWNCKYFRAPQWNEKKGMCWLCKAKPEIEGNGHMPCLEKLGQG